MSGMQISEHIKVECLSTPETERGKERYQAECDACGWHTREAEGGDGKRWANQVALIHSQNCPADKDLED